MPTLERASASRGQIQLYTLRYWAKRPAKDLTSTTFESEIVARVRTLTTGMLPSCLRPTWAIGCALFLHASGTDASAQSSRGSYAVVVGPSSPVVQLSLDQLRRLYLGETTTLPTGQRARIVVLKSSADAFDRLALGLSEAVVRRRWVSAAFRGEVTLIPTEVETIDDVRKELAKHPNAVGYLPSMHVDGSVRVVRIDGRLPADPNYPIR